jgi:hypothetical protein
MPTKGWYFDVVSPAARLQREGESRGAVALYLLPAGVVAGTALSPQAILAIPDHRVFGELSESRQYVPSDGEVTVLIIVRKLIAELQGNLRNGHVLTKLAISRQLIKHPRCYLFDRGHELVPMSLPAMDHII